MANYRDSFMAPLGGADDWRRHGSQYPPREVVMPHKATPTEAEREEADFNAQWESGQQRQTFQKDAAPSGPDEEKVARLREYWGEPK